MNHRSFPVDGNVSHESWEFHMAVFNHTSVLHRAPFPDKTMPRSRTVEFEGFVGSDFRTFRDHICTT